MAGVELLGRLSAGAVRMDLALGGQSELQRVEVAGYLSGLGEGPMLLALAKYMGDGASLIKLVSLQHWWLMGLSVNQQWGAVDNVIVRMAAVSVSDVVNDKCDRCHGTGFVRAKSCRACEGTGFRKVSGHQCAKIIGVSEAAFRRVWKPRYAESVDRVRGYDAEVNRAVSRSNWCNVFDNA